MKNKFSNDSYVFIKVPNYPNKRIYEIKLLEHVKC